MATLKQSSAAILLALLSLNFSANPSQALEELRVYRGVLILEGKIVSGDYNKLRDFLGKKSNFEKISGGVFLASPGGSIVEALKIGRLIRALRLSTDAPPGPATGSPKFGESLITPSQLINPKVNYGCQCLFFCLCRGRISTSQLGRPPWRSSAISIRK
jgi:hypothetical protein